MCFISRTLDQKEETEKKRNYKGSLYGKVNYFTGQIVKDFYDKKISGSGLLAVIYCVKILKIKNIYLFGFDFYQQGMHNVSLIDNFKTEESIKVHLDDGKRSKIDFENFIESNSETNIDFPVVQYPEKVKSLNLDKTPIFKGTLKGIKGQYLIFEDNTVFNVRNWEGYVVDLNIS